jgi:transcriptional regulator with XRE-family HTH domain
MTDIRQLLNMSQAMLASYMGISRTLLAYTELGTRSLPAAALHRANQLLAVIYKNNKPAAPQEAIQQDLQAKAWNKLLHAKMDRCQWQLVNARAKLDSLRENYASCMAKLQLVNELQPTLTNNAQGKKDRSWLKLLEIETLHQLKTCGLKAEQALLLHIEMLELEMEAVQRRMG